MKFLLKMFSHHHHHFAPNGRWERLYPLYEAIDSFCFSTGRVTSESPHVRDAIDLKRTMMLVVLALMPAIVFAIYNTGFQANQTLAALDTPPESWRLDLLTGFGFTLNSADYLSNFVHGLLYFLPIYLVCNLVGGGCEVLFALVRRHEINEGFLVTGTLIPLIMPPLVPLWQVALATIFGVVLGKEVFGGTGKNFLNPALVARAFLFFSYPLSMTGNTIWVAVDGVTAATPLAVIKESGLAHLSIDWWQAFIGLIPGSMGETSALMCTLGALFLIFTGIGQWRIMVSALLGGLAMATLFYWIGSSTNPMMNLPPHWHLVLGSFLFGITFMATDPVSATQTVRGHYVYGAFIGILIILIRVVNPAYPEGTMLAILFANMFAPLIDYFFVQKRIRQRQRHIVQTRLRAGRS